MLRNPRITQLTKNHIKERLYELAIQSIGVRVDADELILNITETKLDNWVDEVEQELRKVYINEK